MSTVVVQAFQAVEAEAAGAAGAKQAKRRREPEVSEVSDVTKLCAALLVKGMNSKNSAWRLACAAEVVKRDLKIEEYGAKLDREFPDLCVVEGGAHRWPVRNMAGAHWYEVCAILADDTRLDYDFSMLGNMDIADAFDVPSDEDAMYKARRIVELSEKTNGTAPVIRFDREEPAQQGANGREEAPGLCRKLRVQLMLSREADVHGAKARHSLIDGMCKLSFPSTPIGALFVTVEVHYGGLFDLGEEHLERAVQQLVLFAKGFVELDEADAEQKLAVSFDVCWDGIAVTRGEETWMLRYEGDVSGEDLLQYLHAKGFHSEEQDAADDLIVIESDEEEEEPPKEEQPRKRTKREVGDQFDMVDLTDDDVSAHEAVKRQRRMYVADDGTYAEVLAVD